MPKQVDATKAVALLQRLTSFMALRDPDLLAAAAAELGAEALSPVFGSPGPQVDDTYPAGQSSPAAAETSSRHQYSAPDQHCLCEEEGATKMRQQEVELARLELEAEATRRKIVEVRLRAEEAAALAAASAARQAAREQKAAEEAKAEEARRELQREQVARASALAAEKAKLAAARALAEAREQEHKLAVLAAKALKEEQDREQSLLMAARAAAAEIAHREQVLAAKREENARLTEELKSASQSVPVAGNRENKGDQHARALDKEARRRRQAEGLQRQRLISLQRDLNNVNPPSTGPSPPPAAIPRGAPVNPLTDAAQKGLGSMHPGVVLPSSGDRDMTPRRRSPGLSPLGRAHLADGAMQAHKKAQRVSENITRREAARSTVVETKRAKSPVLGPDLYAMLGAADAARVSVGLPAHTMESFLLYLSSQVPFPQAAHQNAAPQDPTEYDLPSAPGRSQGAPAEGHCQEGRQ